MTRRTIAVVGAGIVGCLIARELAAADAGAVITVLDRDLIGSGTSRRSGGLSLGRGATPRTRRMSAFSHAYYGELKAAHPDLPIYPLGGTVLAGRASDLPALGYLPEVTRPAPASDAGSGRLASQLTLPDDERAWRIAGCHYADVYQVTQAIAALARPRVRFAEGVAVTGLTAGPSSVTVHCGSGEELTADHVVLAPGPWLTAPAWRDLLGSLGLRVKRIVALHLEQRPDPADQVLILDTDDAFLLPMAHRGHWLFSYTCTEWDVEPDALTGGLSAADVAGARACLDRYAPALARACHTGRVCCDAYSPAREPVVRALDGTGGRIVFAGGANGSGYRLGPAIARQVADLLNPELNPEQCGTRSEGAAHDLQHL